MKKLLMRLLPLENVHQDIGMGMIGEFTEANGGTRFFELPQKNNANRLCSPF